MPEASGSSYNRVELPLALVAYSKVETSARIDSTGGIWDKSLGGFEKQ